MNKRSIEAIEAVAARFPNWTPLMHFAEIANDASLPFEVRLDAAKAAAPYFHPKPKNIEVDPEAAIELECRIAVAKAQAAPQDDPPLDYGERLRRAKARIEQDEAKQKQRAEQKKRTEQS